MGATVGQPLQDSTSSMSPWMSQITVDNSCTSPIRVFLCRDADRPTVKNAVEHIVPPQQVYGINSGWVHEPRATLLVRTSVDEAKVFRMPHAAKLKFSLSSSGFTVTSNGEITVEDYSDPGSVPNNDTIPMLVRSESFTDRGPGSEEYQNTVLTRSASSFMDSISAVSPWTSQITIDNTCSTPVKVFLCRDATRPSVADAVDHTVLARSTYGMTSGWLTEPRATLLIRVGVHSAKVYRMPHAAFLKVELCGDSGLKVSSLYDEVEIAEYHDPGSVPNHDTVPMVTRGVSFMDCRPGAKALSSASSASSGSPSRKRGLEREPGTPQRVQRTEAPPQFSFVNAETSPVATLFGSPDRGGADGDEEEDLET